ncbi:MAG: RNA polymerase sigma factor RpoD/SigA [Dehalococcoidia bacterium]
MIAVSERLQDKGLFSSHGEELPSSDRDMEDDDVSDAETTPRRRDFEAGEDFLGLYFAEVGETPLLSAEDEKLLGSQIEDGKHLARLEEDWLAERGTPPSAIDLLSALIERFSRAYSLLEKVRQHLELPVDTSIEGMVTDPNLRRAIDGHVDQSLCRAIAQGTATDETAMEQGLAQLSLDSRLIPWHVMEATGTGGSLAEFEEALQSPEFRDKLEARGSDIAGHFDQIRETMRQAVNRMIRANLRLVISVGKGHIGRGVPLSDIIQEGNIGLMQAVRKFDHRRGYKFSTYAIPWIWQAINRAVNEQSRVVHLPGHLIDELARLGRVRNSLAQQLGRQPTEQELASAMGLPCERIQALLDLSSGGPASLEAPVGDEGSPLVDLIADQGVVPPDEQVSVSLLGEELNRTLESLTPRERRIIELRFGLGNEYSRTLEEVGAELGLTKERIRQIEKAALAKLRHPSHSRELIGYLG